MDVYRIAEHEFRPGEADEIADLIMLKRGGQNIQEHTIKIKVIAEVEDGLSDIRRMARADGKEAVTVGIKKQRGGNEVEVAVLHIVASNAFATAS